MTPLSALLALLLLATPALADAALEQGKADFDKLCAPCHGWGDVFVTEQVGKSTRLADAMKASDEASRRIAGLVGYVQSIQAAP
ncbi:MAG: hypothetical protein NTZ54_19425 [Alphaproteobacteria bacterium]|nr:hypothetical protein [Alphaproteobacteria bacterium]